MKRIKYLLVLAVISLLLLPATLRAAEYPVVFKDSGGREVTLKTMPKRVVSLVPSVTEMLLRIGAQAQVVGITYHSVLPSESAGKEVVGGFLNPDLDRVTALRPDLIFYADLQKDVPARFKDSAVLVRLSAGSIAESFEQIRLLGRIFGKNENAARVIAEEKRQLRVIADKVEAIPAEKRQRVMRIMGRDAVMAPGDDSFQNEYIRAAGAIAPVFGKSGEMISVTLRQWQEFNPQVVYGCAQDRGITELLKRPGWRDVDAVRSGRILFFPCELTCRAATHTGYFASWLAARVYEDEFSEPGDYVLAQRVESREPLDIGLGYVRKAELVASDIKDFRNKTVVVTFKRPMKVVSTLEGQRSGITTVANHYFPPPSWGLGHRQGLAALRKNTQRVLGLAPDTTAMLFTGANMDNLAVVKKNFRDMEVTALVTAGVMGNSLRMGVDSGNYYEPDHAAKGGKPGTINILILTNMQLSPRAMTRAVISATEAKTAALQDMDIRSSYSPLINQAIGTGTDNIIVVEGEGQPIDSSGGHTKMGELIARAVHEGVQKAVHLQNGLVTERSVFQRLKERKVSLNELCGRYAAPESSSALCRQVEAILLQPQYSGFIKAVMAASDDYEKRLVGDPGSVDIWARAVASQIAGRKVEVKGPVPDDMPRLLGTGLGAIYAGAMELVKQKESSRERAGRP